MNTSKLKNLIKQSLLEELGSSEKFKSIASDIYDELEKMGSYDSSDVDNKIKEKGYDPNSEEGMNILYYFKQIDFDPGRYEVDEAKMTAAQIKKRGEIYDALKDQGMSDEKAGKIATSKAMSVKEMVQTALAEKKKSFPDLTGDGKVTKADILKGRGVEMKEDLDIGHQDDEPDMLKADVYRIAEYAVALYKMLDKFDKMEGEVDFPDWWQQKIHIAAEYMDKAKHYLEFEMNQPAVDKMADVASEIDLEMVAEAFNPSDKITMDVPLFLRMLEYAKEDAKTDMDLHVVTEKAVELSSEGKTLSMSDYDAITKDEIKTKAVSDLAESVAKKVKEARFKKGTDVGEQNLNENKIKSILSKIGDIEEKIYDQYGDDEIEAKFDYSKAIDDIKSKYKNDEDKMYKALESHLERLKKLFPLKEARFKKGTDVGEPGKGFEKIAKSAGKKYGSEEAGKRVAGAVLKKILAKK